MRARLSGGPAVHTAYTYYRRTVVVSIRGTVQVAMRRDFIFALLLPLHYLKHYLLVLLLALRGLKRDSYADLADLKMS